MKAKQNYTLPQSLQDHESLANYDEYDQNHLGLHSSGYSS